MKDKQREPKNDEALMSALQALPQLQAPDGLHEKLLRIPDEHAQESIYKRAYFFNKKAVSLVAASAAAVLLFVNLPEQETPYSPEEIATAQRELAVAFHYVSKYSTGTATEVNDLVADTSTHAIYQAMFYPLVEEDDSK